MLFTQYYLDCLSQASYLVADETTRKAVIVDPRRDVAEYVSDAESQGLQIEGVINTHFHADFIAGHLELAERTGAWIGYGNRADTEYPIRELTDGERITLGDVTLEILETPGHTPESVSVVVYEHPEHDVPYGVLTGDTLFIGDVGRPDLLASVGYTSDELARMLYDSVHNKLMRLPDATRVFPAHGAGSACGKNISTERQSTIAVQRATNYACQPMERERFVDLVTADQSVAPAYFSYDADLNRRQRPLLDTDHVARELDPAAFLKARVDGATVVDARDPQEFAAGHLRGALNIPADGRFAETAGTVLSPAAPVVVLAPAGQGEQTAIRLARVGLDKVEGFLDDPQAVLRGATGEVERSSRVTADQLPDIVHAGGADILDVRNPGERANGSIAGSVHIPLGQLPDRLGDVPSERPLIVHCAGGYRSSVAASLLRANGWTGVSDLLGGYSAYQQAHDPACGG
ncbi:MBL fold metallo-hydrolase [Haloechinothrix sp. LS1_15]|uniref:MBL fold metallo-hydrolase n=1 Tax=Haloechinothrix sp. LS1_15 TaxID=2652248 RepID=UPI0029443D33|nr:MBL fold metallo-hydrolase [Haloechinothrix sp. LS1_15]MDV6013794.1 MBL fold metallo-hydrolase [Haloechinothrix sp. LS1_15]